MLRNSLPKENIIDKIRRQPYSTCSLEESIKKKKPTIFTNMSLFWPAHQKWDLEFFLGLENDYKVITKDIAKNRKTVRDFKDAISSIFSEKHDNKLVIQMAQIISGRFFCRAKPCLKCLADDIILPQELNTRKLVEVNFWASHGHSITELHYDPLDNLLTLIKGTKTLLIFPPKEGRHLKYDPKKINNKSITHSPINFQNKEHLQSKSLNQARYYQVTIFKGDTLFIPNGFWHVVESSELNLAVNIWWLPRLIDYFQYPCFQFWKNEIFSRFKGKGSCVPHEVKTQR